MFKTKQLHRLHITNARGCRQFEQLTKVNAHKQNVDFATQIDKPGYSPKLWANFSHLEILPNEDAYCLRVDSQEHSWTVNGIVTKNTEIVEHNVASQYNPDTGEKTVVGETAVCNLGSIVLSNHVHTNPETGEVEVNWNKLAFTIKVACRALDNVIDINFYPTLESKKSNFAHRFVGLGVMGLHDMMHALNIHIDSLEAAEFNNHLFEFISAQAFLQGTNLAQERGAYSTFKGSLIDQGIFPYDTYVEQMKTRHPDTVLPAGLIDKPSQTTLWALVKQRVQQYGLRNALTMAIAPTACQKGTNQIITSEGNKSIYQILEDASIDWKEIEKSNTQQWVSIPAITIPTRNGLELTTQIWYNGIQPTYDIEFEDGTIYSYTGNHQLLVRRLDQEVWVMVCDLTDQDDIVNINE